MAPVDVIVTHRYPEGGAFRERVGANAVAVLHVLLQSAREVDGELVLQMGVREIASRAGGVSKDLVNRTIHQLVRCNVLAVIEACPFTPTSYAICLRGTGICVTYPDAE